MGAETSRNRDTRTIRVALVGLGWAARSIWLPRLRAHPAFTPVAAVDPVPVVRASFARGNADLAILPALADLDPDSVDLAVVAVPNHLHSEIACRLLERGVPVFLEKPVCLSTAEADALALAERVGDTVLLAGSAARFRADIGVLYDLVGELGRIRHVDSSWVRARGIPDAGGWFTSRRLAGGGALVDLGWHLFDTLVPIIGQVGYSHAVGTISDDFVRDGSRRAAWREDEPVPVSPAAGGVEDTARCFLITENGVSVSLRASWASHEPIDVTSIAVEGSAGVATLRGTFGFSPNREQRSTLSLVSDGEVVAVPIRDEPIGAEYERQLDGIPALLTDPASQGRAIAEGRRIVRVIERIYQQAGSAPALAATSQGAQ